MNSVSLRGNCGWSLSMCGCGPRHEIICDMLKCKWKFSTWDASNVGVVGGRFVYKGCDLLNDIDDINI